MSAIARSEVDVKQIFATGFGFLAASALPAAYLATVFPLSGDSYLQSIVGTFLVAYFFAATATAILGVPIFIVLNKLKLVGWWSATISGALVGMIALLAVRFGGGIELATLLRFAMLGGAAGFLFWIFWRTGRA